MRVLYVEDELRLAEAVVYLLEKAGIKVDHAADGEKGLELASKNPYDCLILDIMLPKISGLEVLKSLRERGNITPVIMLSALSEVDDKVTALEAGADDYMSKPFKTAELIARIKALTRRPPLTTSKMLEYGDLTYDPENRTVNGLELTAKEAELLEILIKNPETVQTKAHLLAHTWGGDANVADNYVEVYVSYLRKKLAKLGTKAQIHTVRNLGYKLTQEN